MVLSTNEDAEVREEAEGGRDGALCQQRHGGGAQLARYFRGILLL